MMLDQRTLRIFIGYDSKEPIAFHVLAHSIMTRATCQVAIIPLVQSQLRASGVYTRPRGPTESTEFSMTRFLIPYLSGYSGYSVFMDCDMLCLTDIAQLWAEIERQMDWCPLRRPNADKAVLVCQHDYTPTEGTKFLGQVQTAYPRKNWSSFVVFDNARCRALLPDYVNSASGLELHRFKWLADEQIGALPLEWNWLVGDYPPATMLDGVLCNSFPVGDLQAWRRINVLHYTLGGPWFAETADCDHSDLWLDELGRVIGHQHIAAAA